MRLFIDQLAQSLFQKDKLEHCSLQELQQAVDRYPYFSAAHLLLCKKLQQENSSGFDVQVQRTALFFPNIAWLEHLLYDTGGAEQIVSAEKEETGVLTDISAIGISDPPAETTNNNAWIMADEIKEDETATSFSVEGSNPPSAQTEDSVRIAPLKIEPIDPSTESFTFAPLYTVDYFASQGIKFREEEKPKDKFGQQLKSFTEWLKTLKTTPVTEIAKKIEPVAEQKIEIMAGESIQDRDIVTEAMAEVWEKQGNHVKALEIYNKLSLLEPDKSRYFAAKIDALKKTN